MIGLARFMALRWRHPAKLVAALACAGVMAASLPFDFTHVGSFRQMNHTGDTAGKAALASLPQQPGTWGVGATAGLEGEIVQLDGRLLVTPGSDEQGRVRPPQEGEQALLFAAGRVQAWQDVAVPRDMDAAAFEGVWSSRSPAPAPRPRRPSPGTRSSTASATSSPTTSS